LVRVSHLWFGFGYGKFPLKIPNFSIFCPSGKKSFFGPGQRRVSPLFTLGQKYAPVCSGQGPSVIFTDKKGGNICLYPKGIPVGIINGEYN